MTFIVILPKQLSSLVMARHNMHYLRKDTEMVLHKILCVFTEIAVIKIDRVRVIIESLGLGWWREEIFFTVLSTFLGEWNCQSLYCLLTALRVDFILVVLATVSFFYFVKFCLLCITRERDGSQQDTTLLKPTQVLVSTYYSVTAAHAQFTYHFI